MLSILSGIKMNLFFRYKNFFRRLEIKIFHKLLLFWIGGTHFETRPTLHLFHLILTVMDLHLSPVSEIKHFLTLKTLSWYIHDILLYLSFSDSKILLKVTSVPSPFYIHRGNVILLDFLLLHKRRKKFFRGNTGSSSEDFPPRLS